MTNFISRLKIKKSTSQRGDTIIEVLIALAVMSFALGVSYKMAGQNLKRGISARERVDAVSLIESQIAELKVRQKYYTDVNQFNTDFGTVGMNFCLYDDPYSSNKPNKKGDANWSAISSTDSRCSITLNGVSYRLSLTTQYIPGYPAGVNNLNNYPIVYKVTATWDSTAGNGTNTSTIYYRF